jgi:tetratricopeptide (TPR) repeat protein
MSMFLGDFGDAKRRFGEGLALYRALGNHSGVTNPLAHLAEIATVEGRFKEAERLARESVATAREGGIRTELANALLNLGIVLEKVAEFSEARSVLQQSLALYTDLGHHNYITEAHAFLGSVEMHLGRYEQARGHLQESLALARKHGPPYCVGLNLLLLGSLGLAEGAHAQAHSLLQEGVDAYRETGGHQDDKSWAQANLALATHELGDTPGAREHLCQAIEIAQKPRAVLPLLWALPVAAWLLVGEGENERAVELYALASRYPLVAQSQWFADVVGKQMLAAANTLPAGRVAILEERGRTRDLEATVAELLAELCE